MVTAAAGGQAMSAFWPIKGTVLTMVAGEEKKKT